LILIKPLVIIALSGIFLCSSCRLPTAELTPEEMDLLDTLYANRVRDLRPELDSSCTARHDSLRQRAVDSLVELQLTEIKKLTRRQ